MWLKSDRGVTGALPVASDRGTFHDCSTAFTSASRSSLPSWASRIAAIAVTGLLIDAAWKRVVASTAFPVTTSATP